MQIDANKAYREWARETAEPFNAEDAYCAGFQMAMRMRDEEKRREELPVVKSLRALARLNHPFG
jgi:hypothetical protein